MTVSLRSAEQNLDFLLTSVSGEGMLHSSERRTLKRSSQRYCVVS